MPKFLYTHTAGSCAQKREEKTTPRAQEWLPLSKGLSPSAPNLPYRESPGSKPGVVCLCQNDFLAAHTICGSRIVRDDGGWRGAGWERIARWKDSTTAQIAMKTFKVSSVTEPSAEILETKVSVQLATHQTLLLCRREPSLLLHRQTSLPPASLRFSDF